MLSEYEYLITKISEKSTIPRKEIEQLIQRKKEKIGAGYLTDTGALYLIASDLGISLTDISEAQKQPMDDIHVEEISQQDLDEKANTLRNDKRRKSIKAFLPMPTLLTMLYGVGGIISKYGNPGNTNNPSLFVGGLIALCVGIVCIGIIFKLPSRQLTKKEIIFFEFYTAYQKIKKYAYRESNYNTKNYQDAVQNLAYFVGNWTRRSSPTDISELPDSLSSNLKGKIISIFKENDSNKIERFIEILEKMVMFSYTKEPTAQLLRAFNNEMGDIKVKEEIKLKEESSFWNRFLKLFWVSPLSGFIIYLVFNHVDSHRFYDSLGYGVTASILILVGIVTVAKMK